MRRLEISRPLRTTITARARNAGEAVQQLAHLSRERQRLGQERIAVMRRIRKIDARLEAIAATEGKLLPMIQVEATAQPAPAAKRPAILPPGPGEVKFQY
jgi:hypothetical protein